jgi:hypothetical protein
MINKETEDKNQESQETTDGTVEPDENSGIMFQGFLKIHDPETGEIYTQGRA